MDSSFYSILFYINAISKLNNERNKTMCSRKHMNNISKDKLIIRDFKYNQSILNPKAVEKKYCKLKCLLEFIVLSFIFISMMIIF